MRVLVCALSGVRQGAVAVGLVYVVRGLKVRGEGGGAWVRSGASSLQHHSATWRMAEGMRMLSLHLNLFFPPLLLFLCTVRLHKAHLCGFENRLSKFLTHQKYCFHFLPKGGWYLQTRKTISQICSGQCFGNGAHLKKQNKTPKAWNAIEGTLCPSHSEQTNQMFYSQLNQLATARASWEQNERVFFTEKSFRCSYFFSY